MNGQEISILSLMLGASTVVKGVMVILLLLSLFSWWRILEKGFTLRQIDQACDRFEQSFWAGGDLNTLHQSVSGRPDSSGLAKIFESGFAEFLKLHRQNGVAWEIDELMASTRRAMRAAQQRELNQLEAYTSFLATAGSIAPYIGLLGTVWGIMTAFHGLAKVGQSTLAQVAPGIAEALVATAMGLFVAIPAVAAYNRFVYQIDRLTGRFDGFIEEFSNILQRQAARAQSRTGSTGPVPHPPAAAAHAVSPSLAAMAGLARMQGVPE